MSLSFYLSVCLYIKGAVPVSYPESTTEGPAVPTGVTENCFCLYSHLCIRLSSSSRPCWSWGCHSVCQSPQSLFFHLAHLYSCPFPGSRSGSRSNSGHRSRGASCFIVLIRWPSVPDLVPNPVPVTDTGGHSVPDIVPDPAFGSMFWSVRSHS